MRRHLLAASLAVLLLLSGCWSRREINDLALVVSLGIDLTEEGLLEVVIAIAEPGAGAAGKQAQPVEKAKVLLLTRGRTIAEALRSAELSSPRRIGLHHSTITVVGERLAAAGLDQLLEYLLRSPQVRLSSRLLMVRGSSPAELIGTPALMKRVQAQALSEIQANEATLEVPLREYFIAQASRYQAVLVPVVRVVPHPTEEVGAPGKQARFDGAVLLQNGKAVTYLSQEEVRGAMWLRNAARNAVVTVECPNAPGRYASARMTRASARIQPAWTGQRLQFQVRLSVAAHLADIQCEVDLSDLATLQKFERRIEAQIVERVDRTVSHAQRAPADPFSFGEHVRAYLPGVWQRVGDERWPKAWQESTVRLQANVTLVNPQMTVKSPPEGR